MTKLLLIANASSIWTQEIVKNIHVPLRHQINLATFDECPQDLVDSYGAMNARVILLSSDSKGPLGKIKKALALLHHSLKSRRLYDLVVVHCPPNSFQAYALALAVKLISCRTVTVFWGSDIQAIGENEAKRLAHLVKISDAINLSTSAMRQSFDRFFSLQEDQEVHAAKFGTLAFSFVDDLLENSSSGECKRHFGMDEEKVSLAIGYGGRPRHQHLKVLEALADLPESAKQSIQLILHMYHGEEPYVHQVCETAENLGFDYVLIRQSLGLEEVAMLRIATDVFLHAQPNDGMSSSVRECLYAGAVLINPRWIQYQEFEQIGVDYITYDSFDEIALYVDSLLRGEAKVDVEKNRKLIGRQYSWDGVREDWVNLLGSTEHD